MGTSCRARGRGQGGSGQRRIHASWAFRESPNLDAVSGRTLGSHQSPRHRWGDSDPCRQGCPGSTCPRRGHLTWGCATEPEREKPPHRDLRSTGIFQRFILSRQKQTPRGWQHCAWAVRGASKNIHHAGSSRAQPPWNRQHCRMWGPRDASEDSTSWGHHACVESAGHSAPGRRLVASLSRGLEPRVGHRPGRRCGEDAATDTARCSEHTAGSCRRSPLLLALTGMQSKGENKDVQEANAFDINALCQSQNKSFRKLGGL